MKMRNNSTEWYTETIDYYLPGEVAQKPQVINPNLNHLTTINPGQCQFEKPGKYLPDIHNSDSSLNDQ